jgi:predicted nucleic acid-binding Zn ribbon protein
MTLHCPECGRRIPPHEDHCEACHPVADETMWPTRALIGMCAVYFLVVLINNLLT